MMRAVMPIIFVVPVYAVLSSWALVAETNRAKISILLVAARDFYESIVLVAFMQFVAEFWGGAHNLACKVDSAELVVGKIFPTVAAKIYSVFGRCIRKLEPYPDALMDLRVVPFPRAPGAEFVAWSFVGVLQYAVVMWCVMLANFGMWSLLFYGQLDHGTFERVGLVIKGIKGASNLWAMWNLLVLYEYLIESPDTEPRMARIKPLHKFVCIKLIVIFSLWQEFILKALSKKGLLPNMWGMNSTWSDQEALADAVVNFLVCLEMLLFAQWHRYAYPFNEKWDEETKHETKCQKGSSLPHWLRLSVFQMTDDIGYLIKNRARRQRRVYKMIRQVNVNWEEVHEDFKYFELDSNAEASVGQLQFGLMRSGLANWHRAREILLEKDVDRSGRLSFKEFKEVAIAVRAGQPGLE